MDCAEAPRRERIRQRKWKKALRLRQRRQQREQEQRLQAYTLRLTSDPKVAASPYETPDPGWSFPYGRYWRICDERLPELVAMASRLTNIRAMRNWVNDDLYLLRLDLLIYSDVACCGLADYLRPGREHWGASDEDWEDPDAEPAEEPAEEPSEEEAPC